MNADAHTQKYVDCSTQGGGSLNERDETGFSGLRAIFSIIIPTRNRPDQLAKCLASISNLDYPKHAFEVIVVNDGGDACCDAVIAAYQGHMALTLLWQSNRGPATARNVGAKCAKGQFIAFTDDDCVVDKHWLTSLHRSCMRHRNALIGGLTLNGLPSNVFSSCSQLLQDYVYSVYNRNPNDARFFASNNMSVATAAFQEVHGFNTGFSFASEDRDFCLRWHVTGNKMVYDTGAIIVHEHSLTLAKFLLQHFRYGQGAAKFRYQPAAGRAMAEAGAGWQKPRFYLDLLLYPLRRLPVRRAVVLMLLLLLSQVSSTCGYIWFCWTAPRTAGR